MTTPTVATTKATVKQTAIIRFMSDGTIDVRLTGVEGITARVFDTISTKLYNELNRQRALERHKLAIKLLEEKSAAEKKAAEEAKLKEEVKA